MAVARRRKDISIFMERLLIFMLWLCLLPRFCISLGRFGSRLQDARNLGSRLEPTFEAIPARESTGRGPIASGSYALWQAPPSPTAVLFIAHGLLQGPEAWWDASPACPFCNAGPEERAIVLSALARGHAVITIKSAQSAANGTWPDGCKTPCCTQHEIDVVQEYIESWSLKHGTPDRLPVAALGVSAGGYLVSTLALQMELYGIVLQISSGCTQSFETARAPFPPSLFVSMPRDAQTEEEIRNTIHMLSRKGLRADSLGCQPFPVYKSYLAERLPGLGLEVSTAVYEALAKNGCLDTRGYLNKPVPVEVVDWRVYAHWDWLSFLESLHVLPHGSNWTALIAQELAVSYAFHAVTSRKATKMLNWLDDLKDEHLPRVTQDMSTFQE